MTLENPFGYVDVKWIKLAQVRGHCSDSSCDKYSVFAKYKELMSYQSEAFLCLNKYE
jgi:hypothetical protein